MKKSVVFCIILLLLTLVFICFYDNIIEDANTIYLKLQKAAAEGQDVTKLILSILTIGTFFIIVLAVLIFILSSNPKPSLLFGFLFFLLFGNFILVTLTRVYQKEITDYLKVSYQATQEMNKEKK